MERFGNQNYRNGSTLKFASAYDSLGQSNRKKTPMVKVSFWDEVTNEEMNHYIDKQAKLLEEEPWQVSIEKEAFLSGNADLFTKAKNMIVHNLGVTEEIAEDLASPVVMKVQQLQQSYGGDGNEMMEGIIHHMKGHLAEHPDYLHRQIGSMKENMGVVNTKSLEDQIKDKLRFELHLSNNDADRMKKIVVNESRDLVTMMRPHKMNNIAFAIVELMKQHHDATIAYNIKDHDILVKQLKQILASE